MICGLAIVDAALGARPEAEPPVRDITELSLEDLLQRSTTTATKSASTAREAPSIVTVISGDEIRDAGYTSVADVLRGVPGLYDLYDHVGHNLGVRGVSGGARAYGNVLQVRIDDQAVPLRTSTGNLFGEELVPIEAIERIEVLRGPASALYGANAFLGVVRIVTRDGESVHGAGLVGHAGVVGTAPGGGAGVVVGGSGEHVDAFLAAKGFRIDRSGAALPATSPVLEAEPGLRRATSRDDLARPTSIVGHVAAGREDGGGRVTAWGAMQELDATGEFLDFAPMTHGTRIAMRNQHYRLSWLLAPGEATRLQAWVAAFDTRPTAEEVIDLGVPDERLLRDVAASGTETGAEARVAVSDGVAVTIGGEWLREHHVVQSYDTLLLADVFAADGALLREAGTILPGDGEGETADLSTVAGYGQVEARMGVVSATLGVRVDRHTVYGVEPSPRVGLVLAPPAAPYSLKLLYGGSFKAPSAEQLYGYPIADFDIRGNPDLQEQRAHTGEVGGTWDLGPRGAVLADVFVTAIDGRVEYLQQGLWLQAENALSEVYVGGEVESHLRIVEGVTARAGLAVARSVVQTRAEGVVASEPFASPYPTWQAFAAPVFSWNGPGLRVEPQVLVVGQRPSSQSNTLQAGEPYVLPTTADLALSAGFPRLFLVNGLPTAILVRATDLLDTRAVDPGFGGVDYPGLGRTVWLTVRHGL